MGYAGALLFSPLVAVRIHINTETYTEERQHSYHHRIVGLEGILKLICFQLPCHDEAHILPDQAAHFYWRGQQKEAVIVDGDLNKNKIYFIFTLVL